MCYLESEDDKHPNYVLFSQYSGNSNIYGIQRDKKWLLSISNKEYEVIYNFEEYKEQLQEKIEKNLKDKDESEQRIIENNHENFERNISDFEFYRKNFPVLILKEIGQDFKVQILLSYKTSKDEFDFVSLKCNEFLELEEMNIFQNLLLIYWNIQFKFYEDALKLAITLNSSISKFTEDEVMLLREIACNEDRGREMSLFNRKDDSNIYKQKKGH